MNYGIYENNPSARAIINGYVKRVQNPHNKYNPSVLHQAECMIPDFVSDRDAYDSGNEPEKHNF